MPSRGTGATWQDRCGERPVGRSPWRLRATAPPAKTAAPVRIDQDPYPSTYHRYPGALTAIRGATIFDGEGGRIENGTVVLADGSIQAVGGPDTPVPAGASRSTARGKWVTPGHHRRPQPPRRLSVARASRRISDGNEATGPVRPEVWAEHSVWPQDPGFTPRAGQWRHHHAADPARLGQPVRRPLGHAQERAGADGAGR